MITLTTEQAQQIEEALHNVGNALMCLTATRKLRPMYQEMRDDAVDGCNKALSTIRAARAQADHIAGAGKVIGCAYCDNPLFAGTKCNNCGRVTLAEQVEQEPVYAFRRRGLNDFCTCTKERYEELVDKPNLFEVTTFYTAPVSAEAIRARGE